MRTYILADNQDITREGVIALLKESGLSERIVEVKTLEELQHKLETYPNAIVVLDYTLFNFSSRQQMHIVKEKAKKSSWILFSDELGEHFLRQALLADPSLNVVMKHDKKAEILAALRCAAYNLVYVCESVGQILQGNILAVSAPDKLTVSEKAILQEMALGKTTKEIALEKNLSFHTINSHRKNIFRKLEVNNVQEAVRYAFRAGIIDLSEYYI
ncbi:Transcriptional regulatory protein UhpA [termite gut metagenome]|uniref:Transcriptional regulatory protein UhpA n=1 Tax=termite gut metagenome TaxID=433724 RepID=A0A5J4S7Y6_9ZZZZ